MLWNIEGSPVQFVLICCGAAGELRDFAGDSGVPVELRILDAHRRWLSTKRSRRSAHAVKFLSVAEILFRLAEAYNCR
jgi:hypothetical protein